MILARYHIKKGNKRAIPPLRYYLEKVRNMGGVSLRSFPFASSLRFPLLQEGTLFPYHSLFLYVLSSCPLLSPN